MEFDGTKRNVELSISLVAIPKTERSLHFDIERVVLNRTKAAEVQRENHRRLEPEAVKGTNVFAKSNKLRGEIKDLKLAREESAAGPVRDARRILLMDDDDVVRDLMVQMLRLLGYEVVPARDGREAVRLYRSAIGSSQEFDAVIMDLTVPGGLGGKEAVRLLREADPNVRAILSSGSSNDPVMEDFRKYGFKAAVTKPYSVEELSRVLEEVLAPDCHGVDV
jgi:CheY-like chemotaxis protein